VRPPSRESSGILRAMPSSDHRLRNFRLRPLGAPLLGMFFGIVFLGAAAPPPTAQNAKKTFDMDCAVCHGPDGASKTPVGESLKAPDLRSEAVQKLSDAALIQVITDGKGVGMASFKSRLKTSQIEGLVAYVRYLARKGQAPPSSNKSDGSESRSEKSAAHE
jgi:mono/diheme cytochrome c family protein